MVVDIDVNQRAFGVAIGVNVILAKNSARKRSPHTKPEAQHSWLKGDSEKRDLAKLFASAIGLSRFTLPARKSLPYSAGLAFESKYTPKDLFLRFGYWSHSFWPFLFVITAVVGPRVDEITDGFALGITMTSKPSSMTWREHIYFKLDIGGNCSVSNGKKWK